VVARALAAGDRVTAYVRNPAKLELTGPKLTVIAGELDDADAVRKAVRGADAVISALGPSLDREATGMPLVAGTRTVVDAMQAENVSRFVGMATPSLRDPRDQPSLLGRIVPLMGRLLLPRAYRELLAMSALITESELDWTIARFTRPTNAPGKGVIRAGFLGRDRIGWSIARADIADFLLAQLTDTRFHRAAPAISN
jgi:putative NADH-flavin reductase